MIQLFIGICGIMAIFVIGYITLSSYIGRYQITAEDKLILSPLFFFNSVIFIFILNYVARGGILTNRIYFIVTIGIYIIIHLFFGYSNLKKDLIEFRIILKDKRFGISRKKPFVLAVLFLISIGIVIIPVIKGMWLGGDASRHVMRTMQLLNGFQLSHKPPYKGFTALSYYPFLLLKNGFSA